MRWFKLSFLYNGLVNWPSDTGHFAIANNMYDYYLLKEKFKGLEQQIDRLENIISSKFFPYYYIHNNSLDFQLYMLKDTLEFIRSLVYKYSEGFLIETNFTFRLTQCEKRAEAIFLSIQQALNRDHATEWRKTSAYDVPFSSEDFLKG